MALKYTIEDIKIVIDKKVGQWNWDIKNLKKITNPLNNKEI